MHVQFTDDKKNSIFGVFAGPQNPQVYENLGEIEEDDPRYLAFMNPPEAEVFDPLEKLKAFLAANPDVAAILK